MKTYVNSFVYGRDLLKKLISWRWCLLCAVQGAC